ncbi:MAG: DUF4232 domain-containing protein [Thermomicrobiales bacterium]
MDDRRFDSLTRLLGNRQSRRTLLGALAGTAAASLMVNRGAASPAAQHTKAGADVVERYYLAVATYQYEQAYALLGAAVQAQQPFDDFVDGYADTAYVQVGVDHTQYTGDHEDVQVTLTAWHNDASIHRFSGAYAVGEEGGAARILAATIQEDEPPSDVPPLCQVEDIRASFGDWNAGAGNRYGTVLLTNERNGVCVAAGVPHLQVYDAEGTLVIESTTEQTEPFRSAPIRPGDQAASKFRWANWCEGEPAYPLTLNIAIPGDTDRLSLPMETAAGPVQMPPCMGAGEPSSFGAKAFQPYEGLPSRHSLRIGRNR